MTQFDALFDGRSFAALLFDMDGSRGAAQLGWTADDCVVFEDAAAGIRAGEAAGAPVVVITATHQHPMDTRHPTYADYNTLEATIRPDGRLQIRCPSTRKI